MEYISLRISEDKLKLNCHRNENFPWKITISLAFTEILISHTVYTHLPFFLNIPRTPSYHMDRHTKTKEIGNKYQRKAIEMM